MLPTFPLGDVAHVRLSYSEPIRNHSELNPGRAKTADLANVFLGQFGMRARLTLRAVVPSRSTALALRCRQMLPPLSMDNAIDLNGRDMVLIGEARERQSVCPV